MNASLPQAQDYHRWRERSVTVGRRSYQVATKPGLAGRGGTDIAEELLADAVPVDAGSTVLHLNCGSGLFAVVASAGHKAARVMLSDRRIIAVEAAKRTLALNDVDGAVVSLGHGTRGLDASQRAHVVGIRIPTEKAALLQLVADAFAMLDINGRCALAGATNEGIKSAAKLLEAICGHVTVLGTHAGHRVVMGVKRAERPLDERVLTDGLHDHDAFRTLDVTLRGMDMQLYSRPGVFSWDHLDAATAVLADVMEIPRGSRVLDLGCGSGALGLLAARADATAQVTLVDVDSEAVRCVDRAIDVMQLANCSVICSDVADAVRGERFDVVVTNPPFHVGKSTNLDVPTQFITDAWQVLRPGGRLMLVANRTLPYEALVRNVFGNLETMHDGPRFKVLSAFRQVTKYESGT